MPSQHTHNCAARAVTAKAARPTALLPIVVAAVAIGACARGDTHHALHRPTAAPPPAATSSVPISRLLAGGYLKTDDDDDRDDSGANPEGDATLLWTEFPHRATGTQRRAIARLVRTYYRDAAAGDGGAVCSLLAAGLAGSIESLVGPGGAGRRHCTTAVLPLLEQQRSRLAVDDVVSMVITDVRLNGSGLAAVALGFHDAPESELLVKREGAGWKVDALIASDMP